MGFVERFVAASLRQRLFVLLCLAALVLTGVVAYRDLHGPFASVDGLSDVTGIGPSKLEALRDLVTV